MRIRHVFGAGALLTGLLAVANAPSVSAAGSAGGGASGDTYVVLADDGVALRSVEAAVVAAGGTITGRNEAVGMLTVKATDDGFATSVGQVAGVAGVATDRSIGSTPRRQDDAELDSDAARRQGSGGADRSHSGGGAPAAEPLADKQWDMKMIGATADGSYRVEPGERKVLVGVIDTGIDGTHPDIRPNFNKKLSRNFVTDDDKYGDGADCEFPPACVDPVDHDDDGHGTHVAGTIGAAINGIGIAGVAPKVTLVNIRAGQDSGYFLLDSTVNALTYAGDAGIDVVNMSFYVDPWLFNCPNNPADVRDVDGVTIDTRAEQRTIIKAMQRALRYARSRGVTLVGALGNEHFNLDDLTTIVDDTSPDFPFQTTYDRPLQADCLDLPTMGDGVIGVSSVGPSKTKADYSNWSLTYGEVSAPGGWFRDGFGTPTYRTNENLILSAYPKNVGIEAGTIDPATGEPTTSAVVKDCAGTTCAYYQWIQGTSMASPHAAGVAALIVSKYGDDGRRGGFGLNPDKVAKVLFATATDTPCPANPVISYTQVGRDDTFTATCVGTAARNNIYGHGIVNALAAVSGRGGDRD